MRTLYPGRCTLRKRSRIAERAGESDFPDAERLVKRLVAQELTLSFVPDAEQRLWRTVMHRKYQITRNRVQLHNRLERSSRKPTSRYRVWCPICWAPVRVVCCTLSATAKRIRRRWPRWRTHACGRRPINCATPSVHARIFIQSIGGW